MRQIFWIPLGFLVIAGQVFAGVTVHKTVPPPMTLTIDYLCTATIIATEPMTVYVKASATGAKNGRVAEVTTEDFDLRPGANVYGPANSPPLKKTWIDPRFSRGIEQTGMFPEDEWTVDISVFARDGSLLGNDHINQPVRYPQIRLLKPGKDETVTGANPVFAWMSTGPLPPGGSYELTIWKGDSGQTMTDVINTIPYFQQKDIKTNSLVYPPSGQTLEPGGEYWWRVGLSVNDFPITFSEVDMFDFNINPPLNPPHPPITPKSFWGHVEKVEVDIVYIWTPGPPEKTWKIRNISGIKLHPCNWVEVSGKFYASSSFGLRDKLKENTMNPDDMLLVTDITKIDEMALKKEIKKALEALIDPNNGEVGNKLPNKISSCQKALDDARKLEYDVLRNLDALGSSMVSQLKNEESRKFIAYKFKQIREALLEALKLEEQTDNLLQKASQIMNSQCDAIKNIVDGLGSIINFEQNGQLAKAIEGKESCILSIKNSAIEFDRVYGDLWYTMDKMHKAWREKNLALGITSMILAPYTYDNTVDEQTGKEIKNMQEKLSNSCHFLDEAVEWRSKAMEELIEVDHVFKKIIQDLDRCLTIEKWQAEHNK